MYLAQNKTDLALVQAFFSERMRNQPELHWIALVDSAFDEAAGTGRFAYQGINCYEKPPLHELDSLAPWLLPLRTDKKELKFEPVAELLERCSGRPMISVLASRIHVCDLADRWQALHRVRTPDDQRMLLRLADTRILPLLPSILEPAQWDAIAGPLEHWLYVDRAGNPAACELPLAGPHDAAAVIRLTQVQMDAIEQACEADAMLDFMFAQQADIFPRDAKPATVHQYAYEILAFARACRVEDWNDKCALVSGDFTTRGAIRKNPQLEPLLRSREWQVGRLTETLQERGFT